MYFPISYITCLTLLSKFSRRDRGITYCNNEIVSLFFPKVGKNVNQQHAIYIYSNIYTRIITLMKICQSCVFTPPRSPFLVKIFFMLEQNPLGNLIFHMTSYTSLLLCSINNLGSEIILILSPFLFNSMASFIA